MKRINHHIFAYALLAVPALLASCSQDEADGLEVQGESIQFEAAMPGQSSRSTYEVVGKMFDDGFTVSAICPEDDPKAGGLLKAHFEGQTVTRQADGNFRSDKCRWPSNEGSDKDGYLKFFAFHPSPDTMRTRAGVGKEYFTFANATVKNGFGINYDYRLTKFRVAPDISKQVDFVNAIGEGNKTTDLYRDIKLRFEHQLCGVEIGVWGGSSLYDIEVAGVRIGGTVVEADFSLSAAAVGQGPDGNTIGQWFIDPKLGRGHVDYVYGPGDKVVNINANEHNTKENAVSIMGKGGKAMLIPHQRGKWDYVGDRANGNNGMYFSVLIRMTQHDGDQHCIFPSTDPQSLDYLVFLVVNKADGTVVKRLSAKEYANYKPTAGLEKRAYGWAAAPASVDWKAGFTYSYLLDYSVGVGVHDPADRNPGSTIVDWGGVEITTATGQWSSGGVIGEGGWGANSNNTAPDGTVWWK